MKCLQIFVEMQSAKPVRAACGTNRHCWRTPAQNCLYSRHSLQITKEIVVKEWFPQVLLKKF